MKTYKGIYVSPEFHADFKAFAAKQRENMGEFIEEIVGGHMSGQGVSLVERLEVIKSHVACVAFYEGGEEFIAATDKLIQSIKEGIRVNG